MLKAAVSGAVGGISSFRGTREAEARAETGSGVGEGAPGRGGTALWFQVRLPRLPGMGRDPAGTCPLEQE